MIPVLRLIGHDAEHSYYVLTVGSEAEKFLFSNRGGISLISPYDAVRTLRADIRVLTDNISGKYTVYGRRTVIMTREKIKRCEDCLLALQTEFPEVRNDLNKLPELGS